MRLSTDSPALAVPVSSLRAYASVERINRHLPGCTLTRLFRAATSWSYSLRGSGQCIGAHRQAGTDRAGCAAAGGTITLRSQIPIASGLGSGSAVSTALARALRPGGRAHGSIPQCSTVSFMRLKNLSRYAEPVSITRLLFTSSRFTLFVISRFKMPTIWCAAHLAIRVIPESSCPPRSPLVMYCSWFEADADAVLPVIEVVDLSRADQLPLKVATGDGRQH